LRAAAILAIRLPASKYYNCVYKDLGREVVYRVGARELKQRTGEIVSRVQRGERVILTLKGRPIAVISPIDQVALEEAINTEAMKAEGSSLEWLKASESAFGFWENKEDEV
jgi:prevent-host-death family protein